MYADFVYDAVVLAAYVQLEAQQRGLNLTQRTGLAADDQFASIDSLSTHGQRLAGILRSLQLAEGWTRTGAIYLRGNTRKMPYELVNLQGDTWQRKANFTWNASAMAQSVADDADCASLAAAAQSSASTQYAQLTEHFALSDCSLSSNVSAGAVAECDADVRALFAQCFGDLMGLAMAYTASETSDDQSRENWVFSDAADAAIVWSDVSSSAPAGAQFSLGSPLRVLVHIVEPWGYADDSESAIGGYSGFLPTLWRQLAGELGSSASTWTAASCRSSRRSAR